MQARTEFDWTNVGEVESFARARRAGPDELNEIMSRYDWRLHPETVVGWASAQQGVSLAAAMTAFFNGDPSRFNYMPKSDVPDLHRGTVRLLDTLVLRINAGFYLPTQLTCEKRLKQLERWLHYQNEDAREGRCGRWVFNEEMIAPLFSPAIDAPEGDKPSRKPLEGFSLRAIIGSNDSSRAG